MTGRHWRDLWLDEQEAGREHHELLEREHRSRHDPMSDHGEEGPC